MQARGFGIAALLALSGMGMATQAADRLVPIQQAEMSMLVKGSIEMRPDGSVERYVIDHAEKLSPAVTQMIGAQVSQWRFEPVLVEGKPVSARTNMSLRIVAKPLDEQNFDVRIHSASFSGGSEGVDDRMSVLKTTSLEPMIRAGVSTGVHAADLYLALKIGPDGKVMDAFVQQVNLGTWGSPRQMKDARKLLGAATVAMVRGWTIHVPATRKWAGQPYLTGMLPVSFQLTEGNSAPVDDYGQWKAYFPGPCTAVPWRMTEGSLGGCGNDAGMDGEFSLDGSGPKLLTPLMRG